MCTLLQRQQVKVRKLQSIHFQTIAQIERLRIKELLKWITPCFFAITGCAGRCTYVE